MKVLPQFLANVNYDSLKIATFIGHRDIFVGHRDIFGHRETILQKQFLLLCIKGISPKCRVAYENLREIAACREIGSK